MKLPQTLERVINELSKLPGVGQKSAQRLALYLLKRDQVDLTMLSESIEALKTGVNYCQICHNMADTNPCLICSDSKRDHHLLCVVEEPLDAQAIDKSGSYNGIFHVLGGVLNPLEGIGQEQLHIQSLIDRINQQEPKITEVIIATNPSLEGETTALHISKLLKTTGVKITRIARGLPMGGDLEYADDITLTRALEGRRDF